MARSRGRPRAARDDDDGAPEPVDTYVGSRIRARRIFLGINQQSLAAKLGLTFQQVQKYENGSNRISASRLKAIAKALGVAPEYFFPALGGAAGALSEAERQWQARFGNPEALELIRYYYAIPDARLRERLFELVKAAASAGNSG